ncbi:hypothetical protein [Peribacillus deserti]|uniref:DUF3953 domain-containing protein n=1 Tax=Peribacillus deserti TaxID=673318 RepID=A0A2N5M4I9_9BACI|nr:hypothetical protein [Peribacillus deserti]PLT29279.1 hypothetical protein CUU66_14020 [Peribacillus deserti]
MDKKFGTILCIIIAGLGVLHSIKDSSLLVIAIGSLFGVVLVLALIQAVKEREKWRIFGVIGLTAFHTVLILNYFDVF